MSPKFGPSPTPPAWNTHASTGITPKPTRSPLHQQYNGLLRKDTTVGKNTCGWINGDPTQPFTCGSSSTCVAEPQSSAFGCCDSTGGCYFETACINSDIGDCFYTNISDCDGWAMTMGCTGSSSCGTYVMAGGIALASVSCNNNPDTVYIQTTYAGGPNQQVPMPFTDYLVVAGSAAAVASSVSAASLSAAQASSTSSSDTSDDSSASGWISHHKALLIGVIAGVAVLLLMCCCFGVFLRKKRARAVPAPATFGRQPPPYYVPQQETQGQGQGQEHYPMMHYQYGPNK